MAAPPLPLPTIGRDQVHRITKSVLDRPEFRQPARPLLQRLEDDVLRAVSRALTTALSGSGSLVASLIILAVALALLVLIVRLARTVRREATAPPALVMGPVRPAVDWDADAEGHERAGRWRDAVRCRYRAAVAGLAERGFIEEYEGRTTGEYRRAVDRAQPAMARPFDELTDLFERTWYGDVPVDRPEAARAARLREDVDELASRADRRRPAPAGAGRP